jgi:hypothetical protein
MRTFLLALCLVLATLGEARADGVRWSYSSGSVAAGAGIDSGAVNVGGVSSIVCFADNTAGGSARNFVAVWLLDDKTTTVFSSTTSVTNGTTGAFTIGLGATSASGYTGVPASPGRFMKFQLAAGGAAAGRLTCFGR